MNHRTVFLCAFVLVATPVLAGCASNNGTTTTTTTTPGSTGTQPNVEVKICTMNPLTGALNNLGPSMQKAMHMAVDDVNAAKLGVSIVVTSDQDDKTTDSAGAPTTFNLCVSQGAQAVTGPCCSGVTGAILDKAKESQVAVVSPSATSPTLTEKDNGGYFWRVSPTDAGQGVALATMVGDSGAKTVRVVIVNNAYGNGLADVFQKYFTTTLKGAATIIKFDETATEYGSQITQACAGAGTSAVDAVVFVAYTDQVAALLKGMQTQDCLSKVKVFGSEGTYTTGADNVAAKAGKDASGKYLALGMKGTTPQVYNVTSWSARYKAKFSEDPQQYAPESYDSVMYVALSALAAHSNKAVDFKAKFLDVVNSPGTKCSSFADCAALLNQGKDIDYSGVAHDLVFSAKDEPTVGEYMYWEVKDTGLQAITKEHVMPATS